MHSLFIGLWISTCFMSQIQGQGQGFVIESYDIRNNASFVFSRTWYRDSRCHDKIGESLEEGTITLGNKLTGAFYQGEIYEADFISESGKDAGTIGLNQGKLKVGRGFKGTGMRNTMQGLFDYHRH